MKKQTITVDLETYSQPCTLGNVSGGIHPGEMIHFTAGRRTGKSIYHKMMLNQLYDNLCKEILLPMSPMPKPKYQFSRATWHIGEFKWEEADKSFQWCEEQFGPMDKKPDAWSRWRTMLGNKIAFRDEKDYILFVLRWS